MSLRNVRILDLKGELLKKWTLLQHGDNEVYDEVKSSRATVRNGIWEIDHHIRWRKKLRLLYRGLLFNLLHINVRQTEACL